MRTPYRIQAHHICPLVGRQVAAAREHLIASRKVADVRPVPSMDGLVPDQRRRLRERLVTAVVLADEGLLARVGAAVDEKVRVAREDLSAALEVAHLGLVILVFHRREHGWGQPALFERPREGFFRCFELVFQVGHLLRIINKRLIIRTREELKLTSLRSRRRPSSPSRCAI